MVIEGGKAPRRRGPQRPARRGPRVEQPQTVLRLPEDPYAADFPGRSGHGRAVMYLAIVTVVVAAIIAISSSKSKTTTGASSGVGGGVSAPPVQSVGQSQPSVGQPSGGTSVSSGDPAQQAGTVPFPGTSLHGVLIGYTHSKEGAEAAAANYVAAYGSETMLRTDTRHPLIHTIADPAIEQGLQSQLDQAFAIVDTGLGLDKSGNAPKGLTVVSRAFPVGVQATAYTNNTAAVAVWTNSMIGDAGTGSTNPVTESWNTITLNLAWVNGDWKWSSFTESEGPTPVSSQTASSSDLLQKAAQQFARLRYAP
jgi:hypothetical protein